MEYFILMAVIMIGSAVGTFIALRIANNLKDGE